MPKKASPEGHKGAQRVTLSTEVEENFGSIIAVLSPRQRLGFFFQESGRTALWNDLKHCSYTMLQTYPIVIFKKTVRYRIKERKMLLSMELFSVFLPWLENSRINNNINMYLFKHKKLSNEKIIHIYTDKEDLTQKI